MKSFYASLLDTMGSKVDCKESGTNIVPAAPISFSASPESVLPQEEIVTFSAGKEEGDKSKDIFQGSSEVNNFQQTPGPLYSPKIDKALTGKAAPRFMTGKGNASTAAESFDTTTFSGYETRIYGGGNLMKDAQSIEFALASNLITMNAQKYFIDGYLAQENPLAVRISRTEFAKTYAEKEYPFLIVVAENDYGSRACRVFMNLRRISVAGGYSADQMVVTQASLYCGQVGPYEGQLHEWPTPKSIGIFANGKIDAKRVEAIYCAIAKMSIPLELDYYLQDVCADARVAELEGHNLTDAQLDILCALYAEANA